jgi:hypothetical protein
MSDRFKIPRTYLWDRVRPMTSTDFQVATTQVEPSGVVITEVAITGELTDFENDLLSQITKQILDENVFYSIFGVMLGCFITFAWVNRIGKHLI